jgi:2-dehydro-3-deoxyphosphogluconate aldolase/(4S)-4-hydroxy-2-oxoglutarate aldolase
VNPLDRLSELRIVPVVVLEKAEFADPLGDALVGGGLACAEITLRTEASFEVISSLSRRGDILVGAGTVLERAHSANLPFIPGVATATEVQQALRAGLTYVKFFPAIPAGGLAAISALHGPFPSVRFMPTGGITLATLNEYLLHPAIYAIGGSWMVPKSSLDAGDFSTVEQLTRDTVTHVASLT